MGWLIVFQPRRSAWWKMVASMMMYYYLLEEKACWQMGWLIVFQLSTDVGQISNPGDGVQIRWLQTILSNKEETCVCHQIPCMFWWHFRHCRPNEKIIQHEVITSPAKQKMFAVLPGSSPVTTRTRSAVQVMFNKKSVPRLPYSSTTKSSQEEEAKERTILLATWHSQGIPLAGCHCSEQRIWVCPSLSCWTALAFIYHHNETSTQHDKFWFPLLTIICLLLQPH
jgi:hypothetical protein